MELNVFLDFVYEGREFEFSLNSVPYFLYYDLEYINGKETQIMHLSNCIIKKEIFKGTVDELLEFDFGNNITFNNSMHMFDFQCVL